MTVLCVVSMCVYALSRALSPSEMILWLGLPLIWLPVVSLCWGRIQSYSHVRSKTDTASILLQLRVVKTLFQWQGARPRLVLGNILVGKDGAFLLDYRGILGQFGIFGEGNATHYIGDRPRYWGGGEVEGVRVGYQGP
jgi:hypothetical protein